MSSLTQVQGSQGYCNAIYNTGAKAVNWVGQNAKSAGTSVWQALHKTAKAAASFFTEAAGFIQFWAKNSYQAIRTNYTAHRDVYHAAGAGLLIGAVVTAILCRLCNKPAPTTPVPTSGEQTVTLQEEQTTRVTVDRRQAVDQATDEDDVSETSERVTHIEVQESKAQASVRSSAQTTPVYPHANASRTFGGEPLRHNQGVELDLGTSALDESNPV